MAKYLSEEASAEEREQLFSWVNRSSENQAYFNEMQELWGLGAQYEDVPVMVDVDRAWEKVAPRIAPQSDGGKIFRLGQLLKIAAVLIGVSLAGWWFWSQGQPAAMLAVTTQTEEQQMVELPDGSKVWLNENSKISYREDFQPRQLELEGEAFFDVQHMDADHPFEIISGDSRTRVLGTAFNVRAYPGEKQVEVTVERGKVALETKDVEKAKTETVILTAGKSGVFDKTTQEVAETKTTISNANAWQTGKLVFDNANMQDIIQVLERRFDLEVKIENSNILNCHFTGQFEALKLDELVEILRFSLDLTIEQENNQLIFSGSGC